MCAIVKRYDEMDITTKTNTPLFNSTFKDTMNAQQSISC